MTQNDNFFRNYRENDGFDYDSNLTALENMKNLINHMNIEEFSSGYYTLFKRYHSFNLEKISNFTTLEDYFNYFRNEYNFNDNLQVGNKGNYLNLFRKLTDFMGFKHIYSSENSYFYTLSLANKKNYIQDYVYLMGLNSLPRNLSLKEQFEEIAYSCDWNFYRLFKIKLDEIILNVAEGYFKKLDSLKNIAIRYLLFEDEIKIPNDVTELRNIIKEELFVNIYDFTNPHNNIKFSNLLELSEYTIEDHLIFPLELAKGKYVYKVLLKKLLWVF